ncbi:MULTISPECIES: hypothetical protein [Nocardia]|uniref:hypothetical protein n=1 Tax=Nocardia TaxID=1817 RepID=UPI000D687998|nr:MULTISPECIES: hypothetical protein [Nocardia]
MPNSRRRKNRHKTNTATAAVSAGSAWMQMRDEARATRDRKRKPPYMFDGTNPPTPINEPDSVWQVLTLAAVLDGEDVEVGRIKELFEAMCGDGFERVWAVVKDEYIEVLWPLFDAINKHFNALPAPEQVGELPGG